MNEPLTAEEEAKWRNFGDGDTFTACEWGRLLATLDAARDRPGLDVERLARKVVSYADLTHEVVTNGGDPRDIAKEWAGLVDECRTYLAAAQQREGAGERKSPWRDMTTEQWDAGAAQQREGAEDVPDFLDGARAEYNECKEVRRLLGYLWTATGKSGDDPVYSLFDEDDPIVADVERLAIMPALDGRREEG